MRLLITKGDDWDILPFRFFICASGLLLGTASSKALSSRSCIQGPFQCGSVLGTLLSAVYDAVPWEPAEVEDRMTGKVA